MEENTIKVKKNIDFNCTLAQTTSAEEEEKMFGLIDCVSSVNIPCGVHAGNPLAMKKAIEHCKFKNKVIGAEIGLAEGINGAELSEDEIEAIVLYQLGAISSFAKAYGMAIENVRPSGSMYELVGSNESFATSVAKSIRKFSKWLILYGAAGFALKNASEAANINIAQEVYLDKVYNSEGLPDFSKENLTDTGKSLIRLRRLINLSEIEKENQEFVKVEFDTIHFDLQSEHTTELLKDANKTITPCPVNYNKAEPSGWV